MSDQATKTLSYHRHLEGIARADVEYVRRKDAQYDASWKKRGGVGAWFTIARPMDRLVNFLEGVQPAWSQYDLFGAIAVEGLAGPDGSVIACVRDLRRYLMLVEAHMTEELESPSDGAIYAEVSRRITKTEPTDLERVIREWANTPDTDGSFDDMYDRVGREFGMTRTEAKLKIYQALYGGEVPEFAAGGVVGTGSVDDVPAVFVTNTPRPGESEEQTLSRSVEGRAELTRRAAPEPVKGPLSWEPSERRVPRYPPPEPEPEASEPSAAWPWIASWGRVSALGPHCWDAWHRSGNDAMHLEPRLSLQQWTVLPPEVRQCYEALTSDKAATAFWLKVWEAPEDERDRWRTLPLELNHAEWTGMMDYAELYAWHEGPSKYILKPEWQGWKAQ